MYLDNCVYITVDEQIIDYLDNNPFETFEDWIFEGIDVAISNKSKECMVCQYWFFNHGFRFQDSVCNGCHDLTILYLNISNIAIITVNVLITVVLFLTLANLKRFIY